MTSSERKWNLMKFVFEIFWIRHRGPTNTDQALCAKPSPRRRKSHGSSNKSCPKLALKRQTRRSRGNVAPSEGRAGSPPQPSPESTHPPPCGMGHGTRWPGHAQTLATTIQLAAPRRRRGATLVLAVVFRGSPSSQGPPFHSQLRRVPRAIAAQLTVDPHAVTPLVEDPVLLMDAHRSQARMQSTLLHLIPDVEDGLSHNVLELVVLVLGLGVFMVKIVHWSKQWFV